MAEEEQKEDYKHIKDAENRAKIADDMLRMTKRTHREAYNAYEGVFISDQKRGIDIEQAKKDPEKRDEAKAAMKKVYNDKAEDVLKTHAADDFERALMMRAYVGTTDAEIDRIIDMEKEEFTFDRFYKEHMPGFMKQITKDLHDAAGQHLKDEHIDDIVKYTGIGKYGVDPSRLRLDDAKRYLEIFRQQRVVSEKQISDEHKKKKQKGEELAPAA